MRIVNFSGETILKYYDANKKKRGNLFVLILEQSLKGGGGGSMLHRKKCGLMENYQKPQT